MELAHEENSGKKSERKKKMEQRYLCKSATVNRK